MAGRLPFPKCTCFARTATSSQTRQILPNVVYPPSSKLVRKSWLPASSSRAYSENPSRERRKSAPSASKPDSIRYNYNPNPFDSQGASTENHSSYPLVTAKEISNRRSPPQRVKMLTRDFIDDSLYNLNYGYFESQAEIFDPDDVRSPDAAGVEGNRDGLLEADGGSRSGIDFRTLKNARAFDKEVSRRYGAYEEGGATSTTGAVVNMSVNQGVGRQVWHTPTELFKPWYARAVARFLVTEYLLRSYPYDDLIIYEIGAGNGSLMLDVLDYIAENEPEVYERTKYRIIEISGRLAKLQRQRASGANGRRDHSDVVQVFRGSIFDWTEVVPEHCFFLAFEVLDNLAHDVIRYSTLTNTPYQSVIAIDETGDFQELYQPVTDPLVLRFLHARSRVPHRRHSPVLNPFLGSSPALRKLYSNLPFAPNLTKPEYIPTKAFRLLEVLRDKFPSHRLLFSDFSSLPDTIPGYMAPVVQTRYQGKMVPVTTYLVSQGFFDIFFPTDFGLLRDLYPVVMSSPSLEGMPKSSSLPISSISTNDFFTGRRTMEFRPSGASINSGTAGGKGGLRILTHRDFLERFAEVDMTRCRDNTSPMLDYYANAKFIFG